MNFGTVTIVGAGGNREIFRAIYEPMSGRKKISQSIEQSSQGCQTYRQEKAAAPGPSL
jgi:hypothetical protein